MKLLKPATHLMNYLKYPQKFALISCIFVLPLSLLMYFLFSEIQNQVNFTRKELLGTRYLRPLNDLSQNVFEHQLVSDRLVLQNQSIRGTTQLQTQITNNLRTAAQTDQALGATLLTTQPFQTLRQTWQTLVVNQGTWSHETINDQHSQTLYQLDQLRFQVGDQSNLILDPDLDTYYLMDATLLKLPEIQQTLSQIRQVSQRIIVTQKMTSTEQLQLVALKEALRTANFSLARNLDVAFSKNSAGTLRSKLAIPLNQLLDSNRQLVRSVGQITYSGQLVQAETCFTQANQGLQQSFGLSQHAIGELDQLLHYRINGFIQKQLGLSAFILVILAIVTYLFIAFYQGVMQTVASLSAASEQMIKGTLTEKITLDSRDELAEVVHSFNNISIALVQANQDVSSLNQRLQTENMRMSAELEVTRQLQKMILPRKEELEKITDLDIAGFMEPAAEVGGDYYDVSQSGGKVRIGIGDVTGHGLESGVVMLMAQTAVRTLIAHGVTDLGKLLSAVNHMLYDNTLRMNSHKNMTLMLLEYEAGVLRLSGQHEDLIVVRANGDTEQIDTFDLGFPLGLESDITPFVAEAKVKLHPGDLAVLYTDGITEAVNAKNQQYGVEQICEVLRQNRDRSATEIRQAVINDLMHYIGAQKVFDDITLLVLKQR